MASKRNIAALYTDLEDLDGQIKSLRQKRKERLEAGDDQDLEAQKSLDRLKQKKTRLLGKINFARIDKMRDMASDSERQDCASLGMLGYLIFFTFLIGIGTFALLVTNNSVAKKLNGLETLIQERTANLTVAPMMFQEACPPQSGDQTSLIMTLIGGSLLVAVFTILRLVTDHVAPAKPTFGKVNSIISLLLCFGPTLLAAYFARKSSESVKGEKSSEKTDKKDAKKPQDTSSNDFYSDDSDADEFGL